MRPRCSKFGEAPLRKHARVLICALLVLAGGGSGIALAQRLPDSGAGPPSKAAATPPAIDVMRSSAPNWDLNHDGVYTCEEWKQYVGRLFDRADRNHDGFVDPKEFESIRKSDPMFA
ncbi:MAG TPA: hypothetical protein VED43_10535, partial [Mycobacterium sp.]|nr:hypothetical protein [Mycobacterium sp.]